MTGRRLCLDWGLIEQRRVAAGLTRAELAEQLNRAGGTSAYWWPSGACAIVCCCWCRGQMHAEIG